MRDYLGLNRYQLEPKKILLEQVFRAGDISTIGIAARATSWLSEAIFTQLAPTEAPWKCISPQRPMLPEDSLRHSEI